jgi:uncharacterized cupredoxin-like copper-binding protein
MAEDNAKSGLLMKVLFLIGIIIIIFIFAFALIKFVPKLFSGFASVGQFVSSSLFSKSLKISTDNSELNSGDKFILSWKGGDGENADYFISYKCQENLNLQVVTNNGLVTILCDKPLNLGKITTVEAIATLKKQNTFADFVIKIEAVNKTDKKVSSSDEISLNVKNESIVASGNATITAEPVEDKNITKTNNTGSTGSTNSVSINYGPADLAIYDARAIDDDTVTFTVNNIGGAASGVWYFDYTDTDGDTTSSPAQISLARGQGLRFTLSFDNPRKGDVRIFVDPKNNISETNRYNNSEVISIRGGGSGSSIDNDYDKNDDADLKIMELETGRVSGSSFREDDQIDENDEAAVKFTVKNIGGESTGSWKYTIKNLPYKNDDDYESKTQSSLRPGESVEIIVGFDNPDKGDYKTEVEVDSDDDVDEESESNNRKSEDLEVED